MTGHYGETKAVSAPFVPVGITSVPEAEHAASMMQRNQCMSGASIGILNYVCLAS